MSENEADLWTKRLEHAHRHWKDRGITGQGDRSMFTYLEAYRSNQWGPSNWGFINVDEKITVNMTFSVTNTMISQLSKKNPRAVVVADNLSSEADITGARRMQLVIQYLVDELKMKRQVDKALRDGLLLPYGIVRHGFTPTIESFDKDGNLLELYHHAKPDFPWTRRVAPWDFRADPYAETFHSDEEARWCAFRTLHTMGEIDRNPKLIHRKDLTPTVNSDRREMMQRSRGGGDLGEEFNEFVEVWTVYDKIEKKWFACSPGARLPIREPDDWPIDWDGLPYDFLCFNDQADDNFGVPFPKVYASQQIELNKVRTLMADLVMRMRRILVVNPESLEDGSAKKLQNGIHQLEVLMTDGADPNLVVKEFQMGGFAQELITYVALIKEDIREALGQSMMDRGQRINVESGTEAAGVLQGSAVQASRLTEAFEGFWAGILRRVGQAAQQTLSQEILVPIMGIADARAAEGSGDFVKIDKDSIKGEFKYTIRAKSTLAKDENQDFQKAMMLKQAFAQDTSVDQRLLNTIIIETAGLDSSLVLTPQESQATEDELQRRGLGGQENGQTQGGMTPQLLQNLTGGG
jgi:hypothetical protein